jgi:hypothetical protein
MTAISAANPTLLDLAKVTDPNGAIAQVVELLQSQNEILEDMSWVEGNLQTGHRTSVRTGLPSVTWRKMYGGVQPSKSRAAQITDNCGMLEAYGEVDKALADLNGNTTAFRLSEEMAFIQAMNDEMAQTLFYGNEGTEPEAFTGLSPRFNSLSAENADNIIPGGGSGTDNASIWLIGWGPNTCHGIIPKGSNAGLQIKDLGEVTIENIDGNNGRMQGYRTHYRWDAGLTLRDWRYVVRIPNIDKSALTLDASAGAYLTDLMVQAVERMQSLSGVRPVFYMNRRLRTFLRRQIINKTLNSSLTQETIAGKSVTMFDGIPVRRTDALAADEALVT